MKISIISIFRDEAKYLKEWIEFHLLVGVDQFHLVNNNSNDNYLEVLKPYIDSNIVILYNINIEVTNNKPSFSNEELLVTQWVRKLNEIALKSTDNWMIHVSTDEFLFPTEKDNIKDVLKEYPKNVGEVSVNWTMFGNNNTELKDNESLIEKLTKSSLQDHPENYHVKPIFKPEAIKIVPSVHFTYLKPGYIKVDANGKNNFKTPYEVKTRVFHPLHINHYRLRDLTWTNKKIAIYELFGRSNQNSLFNQYNDIDNYNIQKFVPALKEKLDIK